MADNLNKAAGSESFASKFGAIMSMTGMAIGLGNVWRFPYMVGSYGGGAFVLAYLICVILIVMPLAIMEAGYGKLTGKGLMEAYEEATHKKTFSKIIGGFCAFVYGSMNFYFIAIMGTCLYFMYACLTSKWKTVDPATLYDLSNSHTVLMPVLTGLVTLLIIFVVYKGVQSGIEAVSKVMVPLMFLFFIIVIFFSLFAIDGIGKGYDFYLHPDFSQWAHPSLWVAAMGQALFSIGVGPGCVLIYGSHIAKRDDVTVSLTSVCLLDTSIATIAGMAMIPACIAMGLDPESGSGLIFIILPSLFAQLPLGSIIGFLVFAAIFFAAITSAIAQLEIPVATFMHGFGLSRAKTTAIIGLITLVCAIISAISTGFLDFWSNFSGNYGFIVTAGIGSIVYGWVYGVDKIRTNTLNAVGDVPLGKWYTYWVRYIAIPILIIIMANSLFPFLG
ncbi:MAG: sodium-dependent transporter [Firmicutes bacterium]|nr:sodium-dependent transporter [Bacillota bacterium]MBQ9060264.1 sodium-dependent transporter [Bacillota bacterium]